MEQIKQEIINNIYENGENLITGPVLQEVLLDMVDDVNSKVASASVAPEIVNKTGSWDDAADWVEENSSSLVHENDLDGYATEQWVEEQGYLKEHQDISGLATTESVTSLSESVAQDFANLNIPDISGLATTSSVNALSESVVALSESVEGYGISNLWNAVNALEDVEILTWDDENEEYTAVNVATSESVGAISESVASDFSNLSDSNAENSPIADFLENAGLAIRTQNPEVGGYEYTLSPVYSLSESVAQDVADLSASIAAITGSDLSGYVTTASYSQDSASFDERINAITGSDLSGYATTESLNTLSESVANDFANLDIPDVSGLATTQSVNSLSASFDQRILSASGLTYQDLNDLGLVHNNEGYWVAADDMVHGGLPEDGEGDFWTNAPAFWRNLVVKGLIGYEQDYDESTGDPSWWSVPFGMSSNDWTDNPIGSFLKGISDGKLATLTRPEGYDIDMWVSPIVEEVEGKLNTSSFNTVSASFDQRINNIITGSGVDLSGYATTSSVNALSASFDDRINDLSGSLEDPIWVRGEGSGSAVLSGSGCTATGLFAVAEGINTLASGQASHAEGESTVASGEGSHAEGWNTTASAPFSHAEGQDTKASGFSSHAEGEYTTASGQASHAEGSRTVASGYSAHAEGRNTLASLFYSHAEGINTVASGQYSHAEGRATLASQDGSHAQGTETTASGQYSHAEGESTVASELASHAEGYKTVASGSYSHAEGGYTKTLNYYEHAQGKFNATTSNQIFSVGVGDAEARRKNAISVVTGSGATPSASIYILGVGGYDGTNPQPGTNDLASIIASGGGSGADTNLRNFLFGVESQTLTDITGSSTNILSTISGDTTLGFSAVPDNGTSLGITILNQGSSEAIVTLPDSVTIDSTAYNLINNGVDNSGSMSIPAGEYGDIVVTRAGNDLFLRTSIDVSNIDIDLSGYATTSSVNLLSESIAQTIEDLPQPDLSGYLQTSSYLVDSASFNDRINSLPTSSTVVTGSYTTETWTFVLEDSSSVSKQIMISLD